jgi:hypothetical protein
MSKYKNRSGHGNKNSKLVCFGGTKGVISQKRDSREAGAPGVAVGVE